MRGKCQGKAKKKSITEARSITTNRLPGLNSAATALSRRR
jgi:hypothetical protein